MQGKESERDSVILRMNTAGIGMNLILAAAKLVVGFMIHSRAVVLDALNGFSDIISSLVSMLSTKFASRRSDREHPFGYGRNQYPPRRHFQPDSRGNRLPATSRWFASI